MNCVLANRDDQIIPRVSCNRAVMSLCMPEFFEAEELRVACVRSCRRCRGCKYCSYRAVMITREKEAVVKRVEDSITYDAVTHNVS